MDISHTVEVRLRRFGRLDEFVVVRGTYQRHSSEPTQARTQTCGDEFFRGTLRCPLFLEEALFDHEVLRSAELVEEWQLPLNHLLNLSATHELGHALCDEHDEAVADRFGEELTKEGFPLLQCTESWALLQPQPSNNKFPVF